MLPPVPQRLVVGHSWTSSNDKTRNHLTSILDETLCLGTTASPRHDHSLTLPYILLSFAHTFLHSLAPSSTAASKPATALFLSFKIGVQRTSLTFKSKSRIVVSTRSILFCRLAFSSCHFSIWNRRRASSARSSRA